MKNFNLPIDHKLYIDKYFLRAKEILIKDNLNPIVKAQVFIRKGGVKVYGLNEAIAIITKYSNSKNLKIHALKEGDYFEPCETLMTIEAPIQDIIDLETMYLGVLSAETTLKNDKKDINLSSIYDNMRRVVKLVRGRPVSYFGARHWRYDRDYDISNTCFSAGAKNCSTDEGARAINQKGIGTIPHALETIYHWKDGLENAVVNSTKAFDKYISKEVPRIALVDYANKEFVDTFKTANGLKGNLYGIRIDTCGENYMQTYPIKLREDYIGRMGKGVTVHGVHELKKKLHNTKHQNIKIMLSSGFGNLNKVRAFIDSEEALKIRLFDGLGVGGVFTSRMATMDIIKVDGKRIHKVGRNPRPNDRLIRVV